MDIRATNAEYFDRLETSTMGELRRIGPLGERFGRIHVQVDEKYVKILGISD